MIKAGTGSLCFSIFSNHCFVLVNERSKVTPIIRFTVLAIFAYLTMVAYAVGAPAGASGVNLANFDTGIRPQDDFYRYVNGKWLDSHEIPPYLSHWGAFTELQVRVYEEVRSILADLVAKHDFSDANTRKLADLYVTYMDERSIELAGLAPLHDEFVRISAISNDSDVAAMLAHFIHIGIGVPISVDVHPDSKEANKNIADFGQARLSLPDRDYYLSDQPKLKDTRHRFREHIEHVLALAGDTDSAAANADAILALQTKLAAVQWTAVATRDPVTTYNRVAVTALGRLAPGFDWTRFMTEAGLAGKVDHVNVSQPSYVTAFGRLAKETPIEVWRAYFKWDLIDQLSRFLPKRFAKEFDAFYGDTLTGATVSRPRWLRAVGFIDDSMGDAIGPLYVAKYFPQGSKARAEKLMANLLAAFHQRIQTLDWMGPQSKREAESKLTLLTIKLGYPKRWRDYTLLHTSRSNLIFNVLACRAFEYDQILNELGRPVDREKWGMTPETVNGYYNPWQNEVVLPAALMQPPFFQVDADDAVNYGGIGWFISHELSHAFDNRGSQFDGRGNLRDWMTKEDHERFARKTKALIEQYSRYEAAPGIFINGKLTLGENIADVSGLAIAYDGYHLSLGAKAAPLLDGLTGDQRFYVSFATIWASKEHEADLIARIKSDPHSPEIFRVEGAILNQNAFFAAFDVHKGDRLYVPPEQRVQIW